MITMKKKMKKIKIKKMSNKTMKIKNLSYQLEIFSLNKEIYKTYTSWYIKNTINYYSFIKFLLETK